jgi:hypothetical protein
MIAKYMVLMRGLQIKGQPNPVLDMKRPIKYPAPAPTMIPKTTLIISFHPVYNRLLTGRPDCRFLADTSEFTT